MGLGLRFRQNVGCLCALLMQSHQNKGGLGVLARCSGLRWPLCRPPRRCKTNLAREYRIRGFQILDSWSPPAPACAGSRVDSEFWVPDSDSRLDVHHSHRLVRTHARSGGDSVFRIPDSGSGSDVHIIPLGIRVPHSAFWIPDSWSPPVPDLERNPDFRL